MARKASCVPRRTGTPPASRIAATISSDGSPEVSDTNTGSRSGRSRVAPTSASLTNRATSISFFSERYGKSWTRASTS